MVNKLWYKEVSDSHFYLRSYIQSYINLYFFDSKQFKIVENITIENLDEFLKVILKHYKYYHFSLLELSDIGEALYYYLYYSYKNDFPKTCYPNYHNEDKRNLALTVLDYMHECGSIIFPEDVPHLIEFLHVKDGEVTKAEEKLNTYLSQFDLMKRQDEDRRRWEAITQERQQAIAENKPLPIRPMSIELSKCLKD